MSLVIRLQLQCGSGEPNHLGMIFLLIHVFVYTNKAHFLIFPRNIVPSRLDHIMFKLRILEIYSDDAIVADSFGGFQRYVYLKSFWVLLFRDRRFWVLFTIVDYFLRF